MSRTLHVLSNVGIMTRTRQTAHLLKTNGQSQKICPCLNFLTLLTIFTLWHFELNC